MMSLQIARASDENILVTLLIDFPGIQTLWSHTISSIEAMVALSRS
jgi:hypothetical protein